MSSCGHVYALGNTLGETGEGITPGSPRLTSAVSVAALFTPARTERATSHHPPPSSAPPRSLDVVVFQPAFAWFPCVSFSSHGTRKPALAHSQWKSSSLRVGINAKVPASIKRQCRKKPFGITGIADLFTTRDGEADSRIDRIQEA